MAADLVRMATAADYDVWLPLWLGYQRFYEADIPESTTKTTWGRFLDPDEPMHCALAEVDGEVAGLVHYIEHRSCWTLGNYMYLQDLFVDPARRGRGLGRRLIAHVQAEAALRHCSRVWWLTHETNLDAMVLYDRVADKSGFVQYRIVL